MTLLGGLPYDTSTVSYLTLLAYMLLLLLGDCAGGVPAARLLLRPQSFVLIRSGWKRWFWLVLRRCCLLALAFCGIALIPALIRFPTRTTVCAWLLFTLHIEMVAAVQVLLTALFENAAAAMVPVLSVQMISILLSGRLPGSWAVLLPGNWGSLFRTAEYELPRLSEALSRFSSVEGATVSDYDSFVRSQLHGGFPLWPAIALNLAVLLPTALFAWRLVRRRHNRA